jgi:predicted membrane protein|tara:strand:- start:49 stop:450 length:402 start_codon:yes stop_codon:yes gene_type:complete
VFKLIKFIGQIFYLRKFYHLVKPSLVGFVILLLAIIFILYAHSEYISWIEISGRKIFLGYSYLLKNILIIILIIAFYIYARGQQKKSPKVEKTVQEEEKYDGFDSLRKKEKLKTEYEQILEGTDEKDEDENKK